MSTPGQNKPLKGSFHDEESAIEVLKRDLQKKSNTDHGDSNIPISKLQQRPMNQSCSIPEDRIYEKVSTSTQLEKLVEILNNYREIKFNSDKVSELLNFRPHGERNANKEVKLLRQPSTRTVFTSVTKELNFNSDDSGVKSNIINKTFDVLRLDRELSSRGFNKDAQEQKILSKNKIKTTTDVTRKQVFSKKKIVTRVVSAKKKVVPLAGITHKQDTFKKKIVIRAIPSTKTIGMSTDEIIRKQKSPKTPKSLIKEPRVSLFSCISKYKRLGSAVKNRPNKRSAELRGSGDAKSPITKIKPTSKTQSPGPNRQVAEQQKLNKFTTLGKWGYVLHIQHAGKDTENKEPKLTVVMNKPSEYLSPPPKPLSKIAPHAVCPLCEEYKTIGSNVTESKRKENFIDKNKKKVAEIQKTFASKKKIGSISKGDTSLKQLRKPNVFKRWKMSSFSSPVLVEMRDFGTSTPSTFFPQEPIIKFDRKPIEKVATEIKLQEIKKDSITTRTKIGKTKKTGPPSTKIYIRRAEKAVGTDFVDFRPKGKIPHDPSKPDKFSDIENTRKMNLTKTIQWNLRKKKNPNAPTVKISRKRSARQRKSI